MNYIFSVILVSLFSASGNIYHLSFTSIDGDTVNLVDYKNKKILLVNISTSSKYVGQLGELEALYQLHKDSLMIIAFPSATFKTDTLSNETIRSICRDQYHTTFPIAAKSEVKGSRQNAVYRWLSRKADNGVIDANINDDFKKYLINKKGNVMGIFMPFVKPSDKELNEALKY
jgi:glutathione peroxidase